MNLLLCLCYALCSQIIDSSAWTCTRGRWRGPLPSRGKPLTKLMHSRMDNAGLGWSLKSRRASMTNFVFDVACGM